MDAQMDAVTADRPWGMNNPRWQTFGSGWLRDIAPLADAPHVYVVVWIGDDPLETDGDPLRDEPDVRAPWTPGGAPQGGRVRGTFRPPDDRGHRAAR